MIANGFHLSPEKLYFRTCHRATSCCPFPISKPRNSSLMCSVFWPLLIFVLYLFVFISCCLSASVLIELLAGSSPDQRQTLVPRVCFLFSALGSQSTELISLSWAKTCFSFLVEKKKTRFKDVLGDADAGFCISASFSSFSNFMTHLRRFLGSGPGVIMITSCWIWFKLQVCSSKGLIVVASCQKGATEML